MEWLLTAQEVGTFISTFGVLLAAVFTVAAAVYGFFKQRADNAKLIADAAEIRDVRIEIRDAPQLSQQQYTLLREYHAQRLGPVEDQLLV